MKSKVLDHLPDSDGKKLAQAFVDGLEDAIVQSAKVYARAGNPDEAAALLSYTVIEYARTFTERAKEKAPQAFAIGTYLRQMDAEMHVGVGSETVH